MKRVSIFLGEFRLGKLSPFMHRAAKKAANPPKPLWQALAI